MKKFYYIDSTAGFKFTKQFFSVLALIFLVGSIASKEANFIFFLISLFFFIMLLWVFYYQKKSYKGPVLSFGKNVLSIYGKTYKYSDIENYWIGIIPRIRPPYLNRYCLYLKMKKESLPLAVFWKNIQGYTQMKNIFSYEDRKSILRELKKHHILYHEGTIWHKKDTLKLIIMYMTIVIGTLLIWGGIYLFFPY